MIGIGSTVRVLEPFSESFPGEYTVIARNDAANGWTLEIGDFDELYLEEVI